MVRRDSLGSLRCHPPREWCADTGAKARMRARAPRGPTGGPPRGAAIRGAGPLRGPWWGRWGRDLRAREV
eukprot:5916164-Pyramimonas_sp.AAC.1